MLVRPIAAAALTLSVLGLLTACTQPEPVVTPPPVHTSEPVFASEEEALAVAEEAYWAYTRAVDEMLNNGGAQAASLEQFATGSALQQALDDADAFRADGLRSVGVRTVEGFILQLYDSESVRFYVCEDITNVDLVDSSGASLVGPDRPNRQAFEAAIDVTNKKVLEREPWYGGGVC